jgi:hypothetical protein
MLFAELTHRISSTLLLFKVSPVAMTSQIIHTDLRLQIYTFTHLRVDEIPENTVTLELTKKRQINKTVQKDNIVKRQ